MDEPWLAVRKLAANTSASQHGKLVPAAGPPEARSTCRRSHSHSHHASVTPGRVSRSKFVSQSKACSRVSPHISCEGRSAAQTAGRSGRPNRRQRSRSSSCTQATPAALPLGMPGTGLEIDGAMQQAAQPWRQGRGSIRFGGISRRLCVAPSPHRRSTLAVHGAAIKCAVVSVRATIFSVSPPAVGWRCIVVCDHQTHGRRAGRLRGQAGRCVVCERVHSK
jgi:hypothetical protein